MKEQAHYAHSILELNTDALQVHEFLSFLLAVLRTQVDVAEPISFLGIHR
jgi:hypothetical protein